MLTGFPACHCLLLLGLSIAVGIRIIWQHNDRMTAWISLTVSTKWAILIHFIHSDVYLPHLNKNLAQEDADVYKSCFCICCRKVIWLHVLQVSFINRFKLITQSVFTQCFRGKLLWDCWFSFPTDVFLFLFSVPFWNQTTSAVLTIQILKRSDQLRIMCFNFWHSKHLYISKYLPLFIDYWFRVCSF